MVFKKCIVPVCKNNNKTHPEKIFIRVPKNSTQKQKWAKALFLPHIPDSGSYTCCEDHFILSEDSANWMYFKTIGTHLFLKPNTVPTRYLKSRPEHELPPQQNPAAKKLKLNLLNDFKHNKPKKKWKRITVMLPSLPYSSTSETSSSTSENESASEYLLLAPTNDSLSDLSSSTLKEVDESKKSLFKRSHYSGLPKNYYDLVRDLLEQAKCKELDVLLVLKKVRLNDSFNRLADDFKISESDAEYIFHNAVPKIAKHLEKYIQWPTLDIIEFRADCVSMQPTIKIPKPFKNRYRKCQSIIDCLEIKINKKSLDPLQQTFPLSDYNYGNSLKFLVSCTPNGYITYVSEAFRRECTNSHIVAKSGYLNYLPNNVTVIADRSFNRIQSYMYNKKCVLVPLSNKNVNNTYEYLTIHKMERVIRRIREFELLSKRSGIDLDVLPLINNIFLISCGLINMQES